MITIHTDGACKGNPGPGGWGIVKRLAGITIELAGYVAKLKQATDNGQKERVKS